MRLVSSSLVFMSRARPFRHLSHVPPVADQPIVFFSAVIYKRRPLLATHSAHQVLDAIWKRSADMNGWFVGNYILMPDHVHLFARPGPDADAMSAWVKMWKSVSSRQLLRSAGIPPPTWQEGYFDRYLRSDESYEQKWWYVRTNPVRAGLVTDADCWPFRGRIFDLGSTG